MKKFCSFILFFALVLFSFTDAGLADEREVEKFDIPDSRITAPLPKDYRPVPAEPALGKEIRKYAIDAPGPTASNFGVVPLQDDKVFYTAMVERLEYRSHEGEEFLLWDFTAWLGNDYNKVYLESEGEHEIGHQTEASQIELLYSRNIASFWDLQGGVRYDIRPVPERFFAVLGLQGLAPQWFEVEADLFLSENADISAKLEVEYDILLSQRLILQPRAELKAAVQAVEEYGIGAGLNQFELDLRLRYEVTRKFAPYVGLSWARKVGETANLAEREGEKESKLFLLVGLKFWF